MHCLIRVALIAGVAGLLGACNTVDGVKQDAKTAADAVGEGAGNVARKTVRGAGKVVRKTGEALTRGGQNIEDAVSD